MVDSKSCHGGRHTYRVGEWTSKIAPICCHYGWHLTSDPLRWWKPKAELWLAEGRGKIHGDGSDKAAFESVRIVQKLDKDWPLLVVFPRVRAFIAASMRSFDPKADIAWANLSYANLSDADLNGAALNDADLNDATLAGANLR